MPQIEPMDDVSFWYIIRRCDSFSSTNAQYSNFLWATLSEAEPHQTLAFAAKLLEAKRRLNNWDLWAMWQYIKPSTTRSEFSGFQNVLISMGRDTFASVCSNPDNLTLEIDRLMGRDLVFQDLVRVSGGILRSGRHHSLLASLNQTESEIAELDSARLGGVHWVITPGALATRFPRWSALLTSPASSGAEPQARSLN